MRTIYDITDVNRFENGEFSTEELLTLQVKLLTETLLAVIKELPYQLLPDDIGLGMNVKTLKELNDCHL